MLPLPVREIDSTPVGEDLVVVSGADAFLRHVRFGRDGLGLTTRLYAGGIALFLRWCARSGRHWHAGVEHLGWRRQLRDLGCWDDRRVASG